MAEKKVLEKHSVQQPTNGQLDFPPANQKPDLRPTNEKTAEHIEPPDGGPWVGGHFYQFPDIVHKLYHNILFFREECTVYSSLGVYDR